MQVDESEIVIPFRYKSRLRGILIQLCASFVFSIGFFTFLIVLTSQIAARTSRFPDIQDTARKELIFGIVCFVLILLLYCLVFTYVVRKLRRPSPQLRISQEGIFTSIDSFLFRWEEIKELCPYTFMGYPILGIVPWNAETILLRANNSSQRSRRVAIGINQGIVRYSRSPAPFGIAQKALPITIDELIVTIQEHFSAELHEHHIIVQGWQK